MRRQKSVTPSRPIYYRGSQRQTMFGSVWSTTSEATFENTALGSKESEAQTVSQRNTQFAKETKKDIPL